MKGDGFTTVILSPVLFFYVQYIRNKALFSAVWKRSAVLFFFSNNLDIFAKHSYRQQEKGGNTSYTFKCLTLHLDLWLASN